MPIPGNTSSAGKKPTTPTIGSGTASSQSVSIAFTASTYLGKGTISYTATSNPGARTGSGSSTPITVSSLTNGTSYTFSVVGTTNYGVSSDASEFSAPVTPVAPPPFFPPFFPFFPFFPNFPACPVSYTAWSVTLGEWSAYSACSGGTQTRTRSVSGTRTRTNSDCSQTTETSTNPSVLGVSASETQGCVAPPSGIYYGCCSTGAGVSGSYSSFDDAAIGLQAACVAYEAGTNLQGGVYNFPQSCN
jgi:hypothetical protein